MNIYEKAVDYAYKLSPSYCRDLVHDCLLMWHEKHHKDFFTESEALIKKTIKQTYWKKYHNNRFLSMSRFGEKLLITWDDDFESKFLSYSDIDQLAIDYEIYHTMYPKIHLN